ncbi:MAG: PEGA domain-containing protein [Candidatus Blackburnbacteria bacterium]|nr:PEGA domain-containing protein [Candidatus Blackburnbacteria bacterium]
MRRWFLILGIVLIILGVIGLVLRPRLEPAQAGIQIETNPEASVYINGAEVGTTPYDEVRKPGDITLRLVPIAPSGLASWETKLTLIQGVRTVVKRDFAQNETASSGEVLSFEKAGGKGASLAVVSSPSSASVSLDGEVRGFTPVRVDSISLGEHQILISQTGFVEKEIRARTQEGYKLTVVATLAQIKEEEASPQAQPSPIAQTKVEILSTPTGFLRVRLEPSTSATEAAQVTPGKSYPYIDQNKDGTWFKIEYLPAQAGEKGKEGWVSGQYAKKIETTEE